MTQLKPSFNVSEYELYGYISPFLNENQSFDVLQVIDRVNSQLDWVAQLLGWASDDYWFNLASNVSQKRQLLNGTYGVFNSFVFPTIIEIRNWDNSVVVINDNRITEGQRVYLGETSYDILGASVEGDNLVLNLGKLPDSFFSLIANNEQLKIDVSSVRPEPFRRPEPGISADFVFSCKEESGELTLYPSYDNLQLVPFVYNYLVAGGRYWFNLPVSLSDQNPAVSTLATPTYDNEKELWYLDVPTNLLDTDVPIQMWLHHDGNYREVSMLRWYDPSDWGIYNTLENFHGVWGNKGGPLPFNFVFDCLSLHGFDERKSIAMNPLERSIPFNDLLKTVYLKEASVFSSVPPVSHNNQVWWNSQTGNLSVFLMDSFNCGPWVNLLYPNFPDQDIFPGYVFPDFLSFNTYSGTFNEGEPVFIQNGSGLGVNSDVVGLTGTINGGPEIVILRDEASQYWKILNVKYSNVPNFSTDAAILPADLPVTIESSLNLIPVGTTFSVANLSVELTSGLPVVMARKEFTDNWYLAPPSSLKYIGETPFFNSPQDGELIWQSGISDPNLRAASMFYYNRWEFDGSEWVLAGDWVSVNDNESFVLPSVVDFDSVIVYCDGQIVSPGQAFTTSNYQFSYSQNLTTGEFEFSYYPYTFIGTVSLPKVEVSDSLTTSYKFDISESVFSGVEYYMSPNVIDCETPLRLWKSQALKSVNSQAELDREMAMNPLVADMNTGPGDPNWERYFVRLSPNYGRLGQEWQKINLVCQGFGYWGSSIFPEKMSCPPQDLRPALYEEAYLYDAQPETPVPIYYEPYLYSTVIYGFGEGGDYDNSKVLPGYDEEFDDFRESYIEQYDPLHERRAKTDAGLSVGNGFGDWEGSYYRADSCADLSGFLTNDTSSSILEPVSPPIWDSSIYKLPPTCAFGYESSLVDSNHYKVGYAYFAADMSAAEDGFFDIAQESSWRFASRPERSSYVLPG